jgi:prepilin peptidase CpaA
LSASFFFYVTVFIAILSGIWDMRCYRIPNIFCLIIFINFFLFAFFSDQIPIFFYKQLIFFSLFLVLGALLFFLKIWGAGDAKFLAVLILWIPPSQILGFLLLTSLFGGVIALFLLIKRKILKQDRAEIPYGVALCLAFLATLSL